MSKPNRTEIVILDAQLEAVAKKYPEEWKITRTYAVQCALCDGLGIPRPAPPSVRMGEASARTTGPEKSGHKNKDRKVSKKSA